MVGEGETLHLMNQSGLDRLVTSIREQVRDEFTTLRSHMIEKPLNRTEAAAYLGIKLTALDNRIKRGDIPMSLVHKNGGTPYFFASELEKLLKKS